MCRLLALALLLSGIAFSVPCLPAQGDPEDRRGGSDSIDSEHHEAKQRTRECREAARVVSTGHPRHELSRAIRILPSCGDRVEVGATISAALLRLRTSSDTSQLLPIGRAAFGLVDGALYETAMTLAADAGGSPTARALGLLLLVAQLRPTTGVPLASVSASRGDMHCSLTVFSDVRVLRASTPLPTDATQRAQTLAANLQPSAGEPWIVRNAAGCVLEALSP